MEVRVEPMCLLVHIRTTAYLNPNSSSLLLEISTPLFLIYVKEITPLSTVSFIQHSRNTRSHTETVFLSGTFQTSWGEKLQHWILLFHPSAVCGRIPNIADAQQCNHQAEKQGIRVLCTVFGSHGEHTVPVLFAVFSPQLPRAGPFSCYIFSPPILTTVAESNSIMVFTDSFQLLQCLPITHEIKPKIYGLVFSALHNLMPTCLLLHSPLPSPQMCVCTHTCPHACAHTIHKGSFCFGQAISSWFPQGTMNCPPPVTYATHLRLPSHQLEPEAWYGASVTTCPPQSSKDHHCPLCSWGACFGACWVGGGNSKLRWKCSTGRCRW